MAELRTKIELYANKDIDFLNDVIIQNDGNGDYIKQWNLLIEQPSQDQLNNLEEQANLVEANRKIIETRKQLYGSWESQLEEIYDNGLESWKSRIEKIKIDNPKATI